MKLLFDQNLSPKLVSRLADLFPDSIHVMSVELDCAEDRKLWEFALRNQFVIVTKDVDFNHLSMLRGTPPKVIWLLLGNCDTHQIEKLFRERVADIHAFGRDSSKGTLVFS